MEYEIRPVRGEDAEGLNAMHRMPGVFENTLALSSRRIARQKKDIDSLGDDDHVFVAVRSDGRDEGKIIGWAGLFAGRERTRHSAMFGLMVHAEYQGRGIGRALTAHCLDLADNWLGLARVELTVYADNARAIRLYEACGFEVEGRRRKSSIRFGEYADDLIMARLRL